MRNPQDILLVSAPLLIGFVIIVALNVLLAKLFKLN